MPQMEQCAKLGCQTPDYVGGVCERDKDLVYYSEIIVTEFHRCCFWVINIRTGSTAFSEMLTFKPK